MWGALETLAADVGGATQASLGSAGGGRCRKAADAARDLLTLPCVDAVPTELVICYRRCRVAPGTGDGAAVAAEEVRRREIADRIHPIVFIIGQIRQSCQARGQIEKETFSMFLGKLGLLHRLQGADNPVWQCLRIHLQRVVEWFRCDAMVFVVQRVLENLEASARYTLSSRAGLFTADFTNGGGSGCAGKESRARDSTSKVLRQHRRPVESRVRRHGCGRVRRGGRRRPAGFFRRHTRVCNVLSF